MAEFLPISKEDMNRRGWTQCDFVYVVGDAYVDHPSFGHAIISRVLESHGYKVGIISQPDWKNPDSVSVLGEPRLGFLVCGGNMDSMVNHYSVSRHHRKTDAYTPGGVMGKRPDYAVTVYCNLIRQRYKKAPAFKSPCAITKLCHVSAKIIASGSLYLRHFARILPATSQSCCLFAEFRRSTVIGYFTTQQSTSSNPGTSKPNSFSAFSIGKV